MLEHMVTMGRKIRERAFRKSLGIFSYKIKGHKSSHKKPGNMDLKTKQELLKLGTKEAIDKIKELEGKSKYPFGRWNNYGGLTRPVHVRPEHSAQDGHPRHPRFSGKLKS
jgi:hypothetical protein